MEHAQASPSLKPVPSPNGNGHFFPAIQRSPDWSNGSLQPAGLFNRAATRGSFSLGSILNASESTTSELQQEESWIPADDPVQLGLLNSSIASSLFENRIRRDSSFLLTAILAAAAKAFNPALYRKLRDHAEDILASTFRKGTKSVETAQAVMILTYWKESEDTRAWMLLGYVIRMGMELGWHRLAPYSSQSSATTDFERRQARNIERTWLILFVYDRRCKGHSWRPPARCPGNTTTVEFRGLSATRTKVKSSSRKAVTQPRISPCNRQEQSRGMGVEVAQRSRYRLQLFSLPLQDILAQSDQHMTYHMEALWVSYSSALEMLHLICRHSSWLYFAQDSVHVMTAYSAAFLIKLMLSTSHSIASQIQPAIQSAISGAALVFSQQAAPPGSSCALQSRFLDNILARISKPSAEASTATALPEPHDQLRADERDTPREIGHTAALGRAFTQAEGALNLDFADDETWVELMAEAGFNAQDGVFFA
ncbi:fungal specific transcription factor domain-containing protein [Colletotrichum fioriniae PJ7]|uniref:Fungal specific transcription factor domain-containing protein n=1 Tax=Colletotrichum fioriniae PJ7 TaxID=1445577 RepID=A0A010QP89_9PEZI|nr:fungal specific transcription factor domain-containing protein [Colletotrichum fioriniae PJ7]